MNEVFVLIAKEKYKMEGETVVLTAIAPDNIDFAYKVVEEHGFLKDGGFDVMLHYYVGGELKAIEKYNFVRKDFTRWLDMDNAMECE